MSFRYTTSSRLAQVVTQYTSNKKSPISPVIARWQIRYRSSISSRYKTHTSKPAIIAKETTKVTPVKPIPIVDSTSPWQKLNNFMLKSRPVIGSLSALSNNVAFGCGAMAFLCSDMMTLRYVAVTSQTFMITSNLFVLPNPLWPKLRWNVLLLGINVVMLTNLLLEKQRANKLPEELEALYHTGHFEKRGFDKVNFMKFFEVGHKEVVVNDTMTKKGAIVKELRYIMGGNVEVGDDLATIKQGFIGELSFLMYAMDFIEHEEDQPSVKIMASADTTAKGRVTMWVWDSRKLAAAFKKDKGLSNAFGAYCNHDLRLKLLGANAANAKVLPRNLGMDTIRPLEQPEPAA